jgi:hypothetical protein
MTGPSRLAEVANWHNALDARTAGIQQVRIIYLHRAISCSSVKSLAGLIFGYQ